MCVCIYAHVSVCMHVIIMYAVCVHDQKRNKQMYTNISS